MAWIEWTFLAVGVPLAVLAGLATLGALRWNALTRALIDRLEAARQPGLARHFDPQRELEGLPPPVQRFFRAALADGAPRVAALSLAHRGTFNLATEGADRWIPFTSTQRVVTRRPGFVWDARMALAPGIAVRVHDAAWYPSALLPGQGARWTAVDEHSARVALADGDVEVSLLLRFEPETGLIGSVRAEARGRTVGQDIVMTPWEGRWSDYAQQGGMRVPMSGEVAWLTPGGRRPYWRGTVTALAYEFER